MQHHMPLLRQGSCCVQSLVIEDPWIIIAPSKVLPQAPCHARSSCRCRCCATHRNIEVAPTIDMVGNARHRNFCLKFAQPPSFLQARPPALQCSSSATRAVASEPAAIPPFKLSISSCSAWLRVRLQSLMELFKALGPLPLCPSQLLGAAHRQGSFVAFARFCSLQ